MTKDKETKQNQKELSLLLLLPHPLRRHYVHRSVTVASLHCLEFYVDGIRHYVLFRVWLFSVHIIRMRFIYVVTCINSSFLILLGHFPLSGQPRICFSIPPVDGFLGCFQFLQINLQ